MTKIAPFRGLRYDAKKVEIPRVVAPPYDVIDDAKQRELYENSPYNVVRVDLAREEGGQTRYQIAGKNFAAWKQAGILLRDQKPSLYLYFQTFRLPDGERKTRKGFFAVRRLEKFGEGGVKPHENTFPGPKADRLQLMHATQADLSPVFALFSDPRGEADYALEEMARGKPEIHIVEPGGDEHRLWVASDSAWSESFLRGLHDRPLLIADGHHRYETACNFQEEQRARMGERYTGGEAFNFVMMYFCSLKDPGLIVLPTHRVLSQAPDIDPMILRGFLEKFAKIFSFPVSASDAALKKLEEEGEGEHCLGWVHDGKIEVLVFDSQRLLEHPALNHLHFALRDLDVTILHDLVLSELMGITKGAQREYGVIQYIKDAGEAISLAESKKTHAFLMNATKLSQIEAVGEIGEKMPQKSTFFYPKLLTGLVFFDLNPS